MDLSSTKYLIKLANFARANGFLITAGGAKAGHNPGSLHYQGRAIDVSVRGKSEAQIHALKRRAVECGFVVRDERIHPIAQSVWTAPHLHIEDRAGLPA